MKVVEPISRAAFVTGIAELVRTSQNLKHAIDRVRSAMSHYLSNDPDGSLEKIADLIMVSLGNESERDTAPVDAAALLLRDFSFSTHDHTAHELQFLPG